MKESPAATAYRLKWVTHCLKENAFHHTLQQGAKPLSQEQLRSTFDPRKGVSAPQSNAILFH